MTSFSLNFLLLRIALRHGKKDIFFYIQKQVIILKNGERKLVLLVKSLVNHSMCLDDWSSYCILGSQYSKKNHVLN